MAEPRIIFVNRVFWPDESATAQLLTDLAPALAARGWEVHVVCAGAGENRYADVTVHRVGPASKTAGMRDRVLSYSRFIWGARQKLRRLLREGDVVVFKTDPPMLGTALTSLVVRRRARVCHWLQDIYPEILVAHKGSWLAPLASPLRAWRDSAWRQASHLIVVGEDMKPAARRAGIPEDRIRCIPNWAPRELDSTPPAVAIAAARKSWQVDAELVVVYSGNLGRVHEFATVVGAAELLRAQRDIAVVFVGAGARMDEVKAAVRERRLDNVHFRPATPRAELAAALAAADLHLVTLRPGFEQLVYPSKFAGVLASARPALFVGPPQCALGRLIERQACGATVAVGDSHALADLVTAFRDQPAERERAGAAARCAYALHFRYADAINDWHGILRGLAGRDCPLP